MNISESYKDSGVQLKRYLEGNFKIELYKLGRKVKTHNSNNQKVSIEEKKNHWNKDRN